jgi:hypothetical protein
MEDPYRTKEKSCIFTLLYRTYCRTASEIPDTASASDPTTAVKPADSVTHDNAEISLEAQLASAADVLIQPLTLGSIAAAVQAEAEKLHSEAKPSANDSKQGPLEPDRTEKSATNSVSVTSEQHVAETVSSAVTQHVATLPTSAVQIASATLLNGEFLM